MLPWEGRPAFSTRYEQPGTSPRNTAAGIRVQARSTWLRVTTSLEVMPLQPGKGNWGDCRDLLGAMSAIEYRPRPILSIMLVSTTNSYGGIGNFPGSILVRLLTQRENPLTSMF